MIYVYIAPACRKDAERHNMCSTLESFKDKLEHDQCTNQLERFPPPYLKKAFGRHGRLLIVREPRAEYWYSLTMRAGRSGRSPDSSGAGSASSRWTGSACSVVIA